MGKSRNRKAEPTQADKEAAARLKAIWKEVQPILGLNQDDVAATLGISQGAVSQYLNGGMALGFGRLLAFAALLGVDPARIRDDLPEQRLLSRVAEPRAVYHADDLVEIPIQQRPQAEREVRGRGQPKAAQSLVFSAKALAARGVSHPQAVARVVGGDSMAPRIRDGDTVLLDLRDTEPKDGFVYALSWNGGDYVRRLRHYEGRWWISSDNKSDPQWRDDKPVSVDRDGFTIVGRVRWVGSWED